MPTKKLTKFAIGLFAITIISFPVNAYAVTQGGRCDILYSSLGEAAMRYSLSSHHVSTTIPGMSNNRSVDRNVSYSDGTEFPVELSEKLIEFNWPRNYYKISSPA